MEPSIILDTSTPFDLTKLNVLDNVVNTFYTTTNAIEVRINHINELFPFSFSFFLFLFSIFNS